MKMASIREFRERISNYTNDKEPVMLTKHGKPVGFFVSWAERDNMPVEFKRQAFINDAEKRQKLFGHIDEEEMLKHFEEFRNSRRR